MKEFLRKLFKEPISIDEGAKLWSEILSIKKVPLPNSSDFYRECHDISKMEAFDVVIDAMIQEQLEASIHNSTDNIHFRQFLSSVLGIQKVRERFRALGSAMREQEEPFNPYDPI